VREDSGGSARSDTAQLLAEGGSARSDTAQLLAE